ncbi:MAG: HAMP domain-containing histidine kinase, partial [Gammaproteobacteria bacterium]|nr:HAMP domain-containing histidine kinase [Gammaproteobacteria bacterium]
ASSHLMELINEVLDLSKIEAGRFDLLLESVLVGPLIAESLQLIVPQAQQRGIEINLNFDGVVITVDELNDQQKVVKADRVRLKQVLLNFLSNAVKYNCENGKIIVDCKLGEKHMTISVTDTGPGLSLEQQYLLFNSFDRLGAEDSDVEGTGIGLVITKNIIELMGGSIGVSSRPGEGCTFWVELPNESAYVA